MNNGYVATLVGALIVSAGLAAQNAPPATGQSPSFQSRADYAYVQVDVGVFDGNGQFVAGLTREDFEILEDGVRQTISGLTAVDIPFDRAPAPSSGPATAVLLDGAVSRSEPAVEGRMYLLVLDDFHVDARWTARVREMARAFVDEHLAANDRLMVVLVGGGSALRRLTRDRAQLSAAIDSFIGHKLPSATLERTALVARARELSIPISTDDPFQAERGQRARALLRTLRESTGWLGSLPGRRKSVVLFSEGIDYDVSDLIGTPGRMTEADAILADTRDAISQANRANISIYSIDPRGLGRQADESIVGSASGGSAGNQSLRKELMMSQDSLRVLAQETGGTAVVNANGPSKLFDQVVADNSRYYLIAYDAPPHRNDGKFHRIAVRVRRPGLIVKARSGYASPSKDVSVAPPAASATGASPELREALRAPFPRAVLDLRVFAVPFRGADKSSVLIGVELSGRGDAQLDTRSQLELGLLAMNAQGAVTADRRDLFTLNLQPASLVRAKEYGVRMLGRLELPPGTYELHVAIRDGLSGAISSVVRDVRVPDFRAEPLSMTEPVLTSLASDQALTLRVDEKLQAALPTPPSAARTFFSEDELTALVELSAATTIATPVELSTTIESESGDVLFETRDERTVSGSSSAPYIVQIPLNDLPPGRYVLAIAARGAPDKTVQRRVQFSVASRTP